MCYDNEYLLQLVLQVTPGASLAPLVVLIAKQLEQN
jgi:hypothetical protein